MDVVTVICNGDTIEISEQDLADFYMRAKYDQTIWKLLESVESATELNDAERALIAAEQTIKDREMLAMFLEDFLTQ